MAVAKVTINGTTILDLTDATASNGEVLTGYSAYGADGSKMAGTASVTPNLDDEYVTPTENEQVITASSPYDGLSSVTVQGIPSNYVGSAIDRRSSTDLTASGATVTVPSGYYSEQASKAVASGTAGTPTATKGTVTNHAVSVTPSVTNTTGYITGGTKTGEAVSVSASELVSGTKLISTPGTTDVTNYASVDVPTGTISPEAVKGVVSGNSVNVRARANVTYGWVASGSTPGTTVTVSASELVSGTKSITENGTGIDVTNYASVDVAVPAPTPNLQSKTATPTESVQTITADTGYDGLDEVEVEAISSTYVGSEIARRSSTDLTTSGATVTAPAGYYETSASKSIASGSATTPATTITANPSISINTTTGLITATASGSKSVTPTVSAGYVSSGTAGTVSVSGSNTEQLSVQAGKTVTPTETEQTAVAAGKYTTGAVKVGAISSTYVGSDITQRDETDLTASGATVTAPAGYYATSASKSIASGSATTPATTITANPSISVNATTGLITATVSGSKSVTPTVSAGYVSAGTAGTVSTSGSNTEQLSVQAGKTVTPTESEQTAVAAGKYTTGAVKVEAISSTYVGSGIDQRDETDLTVSGSTVTVPAGYYAEQETKSVASGTAGTPTATKGTVTNHAVSVTPSVTNTTGYITGGTKTGTAVSVSASELVSGTKSIAANGTGIDVTNYASVDVAVPAPTPNLQSKTATPTESVQTITADTGYDGLDEVEVEAISSTYVGSDITRRSSSDLTASGATVTVPSGYYSSQASKTVASGTAGTPTASKGTVSNNSISVTPSVTNTTGYITGGTKTGTAVTVSASELVSGTYSVTSSGTKDVTNYASASVPSGTAGTPTASKGTVSNHAISVTPSVTNTTGFITGSTKTGTAVTVSASELVSGTLSVTSNGTKDVTNYASVSVAIPIVTYYTGTSTPSSSLGSNNDIYLKTVS